MKHTPAAALFSAALVVGTVLPAVCKPNASQSQPAVRSDGRYEYPETRELVALVSDAAEIVRTRGESAFSDFRVAGSRWRRGERYIFVLDPEGNTLVHLDPAEEGKNRLALNDPHGKPIVRGLIDAATAYQKSEGWYHYQWPAPGGGEPRWKSTYVRSVVAPSGKKYVVGCGVYNDRMERAFAVDLANEAAALVERDGRAAFRRFSDPTGPFIAKDAYIFVHDRHGRSLVHPDAKLVGRNLIGLKDARGKKLVREMVELVKSRGSGWVDYMWPKPGESVPTPKSAYVREAKLDGDWVVVGCGVYLDDAALRAKTGKRMKGSEPK